MGSPADILRKKTFRKGSRQTVQDAFLKHLFKNAIATSAEKLSTNSEQTILGEQLSFADDVLGRAEKRKAA